jgi:A/G-specific adenine glycosylase
MLQQTQASRIAQRFLPFMARFPTAAAMAAASEADVLVAWSGLGYNRRALALHRIAAIAAAAGWPRDVVGLARLPGIGPYTARAVASLAFGEPVGVVDTNVRRWLVRRFGLPPDTGAVALQHLADRLARSNDPAEIAAWTHATMEFGARVCTSRSPHCDACPVARGCPSRGKAATVAVPHQETFEGSVRARRGALLRHLVAAPGQSLPLAAARSSVPGLSQVEFDRIAAGLERDGLIHRARRRVHLGGRVLTVHAATIGP